MGLPGRIGLSDIYLSFWNIAYLPLAFSKGTSRFALSAPKLELDNASRQETHFHFQCDYYFSVNIALVFIPIEIN